MAKNVAFPWTENGLKWTILGLNRLIGGFRWPRVHHLRLPGGPKVHFEAENLDFRPILDGFLEFFGAGPLEIQN